VDDGAGEKQAVKESYEGNHVRLRIGDADRTITGRRTYRIRYRVDRAILWEGDHSVLRWNATGTEWRVPVRQAFVEVKLPEPLSDPPAVVAEEPVAEERKPGSDQPRWVQYDAWTGYYGDRGKNFTTERPDLRTIRFQTGELSPGQGITVDVAMPVDAVREPTLLARLWQWLTDNFMYGLIPATLASCLGLWWVRGRDLPGRGTIVVEYSPPDGLTPAEVGTLIDERVDMRDLSATVIDLAVRGYIKISEVPHEGWFNSGTDYRLARRKEGDLPELKPHERLLLNRLFRDG
jgi:hypothetical protein